MSRKRYCHLMMELCRRSLLKYGNGNEDVGKILKYFRVRNYHHNFKSKINYKEMWNSLIEIRKDLNMI